MFKAKAPVKPDRPAASKGWGPLQRHPQRLGQKRNARQ